MKLSSIRAPKLDDGVEIELAAFPGVSVTIVPTDDVAYRRAVQNAMQPHSRAIRNGKLLDPIVQDKITARCVAKHLLRGWKGVEDDDGNPVPFSTEAAVKLSENPDYIRFFRAIEREGEALAALGAEETEALGKS